ncbi:MAG: phosphodiester glycosidase family protein [Clostridia bacterium]|nr:phosphodiester glycosidase family protein [Clostridia bacterium]
MQSIYLRAALLLAALLMILCLASPSLAEYRDLTIGDRGEDVIRLKTRLYELGYFKTASFGDEFTKNTAEKIRLFLSKYGLVGTEATAEVQEMLFSEDARPETYVAQGGAAIEGPTGQPDLPPLDADGTLTDKTAEAFVYKNEEDGLWYYISGTLSVEIRRYYDRADNLKWFETRVRLSGGNRIRSIFSDNAASGRRFDLPLEITKKHGAILAFSDDFFGWRRDAKDIEGIIVREGRVYSDVTRTTGKFPPLDVMAALPDGSLMTHLPDEHTAQEYLDMGVLNTWAFGPILVKNGEISENIPIETSNPRQPRQGMGMLAPNDYIFVTVLGRRTDSDGCTIQWLAGKLHQIGAVEAINLDGGNSAMMVFDGEMLNKSKTIKTGAIRQMVSMIAFTD